MIEPHGRHRLTLLELCRWGVTLAALVVAVTAAFVDEVGGVRLVPVAVVLAFAGVAASLQVLLHPSAPSEREAEPVPAPLTLVAAVSKP
jgi:hypothetical protein